MDSTGMDDSPETVAQYLSPGKNSSARRNFQFGVPFELLGKYGIGFRPRVSAGDFTAAAGTTPSTAPEVCDQLHAGYSLRRF